MSWMCKMDQWRKKYNHRKSFTSKGRRIRVSEDLVTLYVSGVIFQGFLELTLRTSQKLFYLEINRCFAPPKTIYFPQHTFTLHSFLLLCRLQVRFLQAPTFKTLLQQQKNQEFTHCNFNDVGNSVQLLKKSTLNCSGVLFSHSVGADWTSTNDIQLNTTQETKDSSCHTIHWFNVIQLNTTQETKDSSCHTIHWFNVIYMHVIFFFDIS